MNGLIRKTHVFISNEDYCLIRDYFEARYAEEEKPEDFEERVREFNDLNTRVGDLEIQKKLDEMLTVSPALRLRILIPWMKENCERFPRGTWVPESYGWGTPKLARDAKAYFARRERESKNQR